MEKCKECNGTGITYDHDYIGLYKVQCSDCNGTGKIQKLSHEDRVKVIEIYYKATNALMEIGTNENISEELKQLVVNASSATTKIIDYINSHRG